MYIKLILSLFALTLLTSKAQAQTQHYVTVSCKAYTKNYKGQKVSNWTSGKCGVVVNFKINNQSYPPRNTSSSDSQQTIKRYVSCHLPSKNSTETSCEVTKTYGQLLIPYPYTAVRNEANTPELPNRYPNSGAWYGYAKPPLVSVTDGINANPAAAIKHDVFNVEHELLADF